MIRTEITYSVGTQISPTQSSSEEVESWAQFPLLPHERVSRVSIYFRSADINLLPLEIASVPSI